MTARRCKLKPRAGRRTVRGSRHGAYPKTPRQNTVNEYLAIDSCGHVNDLVVVRNCCMARMLPGEAELVSE